MTEKTHFDLIDEINMSKTETFDYPVSRSFVDGNGEIVKWKFSKLQQDEIERISANSKDVIEENKNLFIASCVYPNFSDKRLQKNYGVDCELDLLFKLVPVSEDWDKALKEVKNNVLGTSVYQIASEIKNALSSSDCSPSITVRFNALTELHILPSEYENLPLIDKAYILGASLYKSEELRKKRG